MKLCCHGNWHGSEEQNKNVNWFTLRECDGATEKNKQGDVFKGETSITLYYK